MLHRNFELIPIKTEKDFKLSKFHYYKKITTYSTVHVHVHKHVHVHVRNNYNIKYLCNQYVQTRQFYSANRQKQVIHQLI